MKKSSLLLLLVALVGLMSGCSTVQLNSNVTPGTDLNGLKKFYVVRLDKDTRGVEKLIAQRLTTLGKEASAIEPSVAVPADADAVVTYQDRWIWDITMYMLQLDVQIRNPKTNMALATGHSLRTSLARKSPPEMVEEVFNDIFKKQR